MEVQSKQSRRREGADDERDSDNGELNEGTKAGDGGRVPGDSLPPLSDLCTTANNQPQ